MTTLSSRSILRRARDILAEEEKALELTRESIDVRFFHAVELLAGCQGKVVVTGVGKSGLIGQKMAASFNSTGTTAVFMHAGDGIHGDLGVLESCDVVLFLSYSGSTIEVLSNLPTVQRVGPKIIAMVGSLDSPLAAAADAVLPVVIRREAGKMNLAPSSSTTAMLALGDALALVLSELRGFRPEDFALYHPGGQLGRRLLLRVSDLMHDKSESPIALPTTPVTEVTDMLTGSHLGGVNIVSDRKSGRLAGIVTDGDVRRALSRGPEFFDLVARDIMTRDPVRVEADAIASGALELMENRSSQISVLPVVDAKGRCVGMVRVHDLLQLNS